MSDLIGKIICGYRIVSQIGEGGMGKVYLGESAFLTEYKQQVAIKTLTSRGASERQATIMRDLFIREANIQVQLKHPHIVSVIQFAVEGDEHYLILEYLPGYRYQGRRMSNVADVIAYEMGPIPPPQAFQWFIQTLDAMSYAHKFRYRWQGEDRGGIVHRDVKPANLLLVDRKTVKVSDFGIVKVHQLGGTVTRNLNPGTSAYMAPEAVLGPSQYGLEQLDARADIYSLGVTLFEMLTGKLPFTPDAGTSVDASLRRKQVEAAPPAPTSILPSLAPQIDALVLKAMEKHPDKRYQNAEEFKRAVLDYERMRLTVPIIAAQSPYETRPLSPTDGTEVLLREQTPSSHETQKLSPAEGTEVIARGTHPDEKPKVLPEEGTEVLLRDQATPPKKNLPSPPEDGTEVLPREQKTSPRIVPAATAEGRRDAFLTSVTGAEPSAYEPKRATEPRPGSRNYLWIIGIVGVLILLAIVAIPVVNWVSKPAETTPTPSAVSTPTPGRVAPTAPEGMLQIPGGSFLMGRDLSEEERAYKTDFEMNGKQHRDQVFIYDYPAHEVDVRSFYLDRTEVSNRDYAAFVRSTERTPPENWNGNEPPANAESLPVTFVNFLEASDFCAWRGKERKDGFTYRLPSEEEWEYAARGRDAGKPGRQRMFPWGEQWAVAKANTLESRLGYLQNVNAYPA
ncbi:MAG: bifunctional serine/threonine-protein kinase/formylglycine-generating enzyme family protein, partial [Acidobacteriota bacterium]